MLIFILAVVSHVKYALSYNNCNNAHMNWHPSSTITSAGPEHFTMHSMTLDVGWEG